MLNLTLVTLLVTALPGQARPPASASDLAWLAGCWELNRGGRHTVEQWMAPEGGYRTTDGGLVARIEGTVDGKARRMDFPYRHRRHARHERR